MRRVLILAFFVAGATLAFNLGRRVPALPGLDEAVPSAGVDLDGGSEPSNAAANAARKAQLRRITESNTYMAATLTDSDSIVRRWMDREGRPLRVYYEPTTVRGFTPALGRAARDAFARWTRVGGIPIDFVVGSYGGIMSTRRDAEGQTTLLYAGNQGKRFGTTRVFLAKDGNVRDHSTKMHLLTATYPDRPKMHEFVAAKEIEIKRAAAAAGQPAPTSSGPGTR